VAAAGVTVVFMVAVITPRPIACSAMRRRHVVGVVGIIRVARAVDTVVVVVHMVLGHRRFGLWSVSNAVEETHEQEGEPHQDLLEHKPNGFAKIREL